MGTLDVQVERVIQDNPITAEDYKSGEQDAINYLVGCVLKETSGSVDPSDAQAALDRHLQDRVVEVTLPYRDEYTFREKANEICDNIPDTEDALKTFKYPPSVNVTFEWDKDEGSLDPVGVKIGQEEYDL